MDPNEQVADRWRQATRRQAIELATAGLLTTLALPHAAEASTRPNAEGLTNMGFVTTRDGVEIFFKDWGPKDAQPIMFHHGWPLSADDWDAQMLFFLQHGYRVVAHDRRGHGRSARSSRRTGPATGR